MKVTVELTYEDSKKNRQLEVTVKDGLKGARLLNAVEKAVEKKAADDKEWQRWNLVSVAD
jgi:hypothetical protein